MVYYSHISLKTRGCELKKQDEPKHYIERKAIIDRKTRWS